LKSLLEISPASTLFVYVGQLGAGRGIQLVVDAFSSPQGQDHVVFIGDGPLRDTVEVASGRSARVHLMNPVKYPDLVGFISSADYGLCIIEPVSLSYRHALPNKLFEFAFAGLPVVASNLPDMAALVRDHSLGVSVEPSAEGVAKGLKLVKGFQVPDPLTLTALGWESQAEKIRTTYELIGALKKPQ
jgi:glycosyltransferase involved in cell wall biosynthesis